MLKPESQSVLEQIIDGIGDKQMLLVLDNFEHLIDGAAPLVSSLLSACSRLKIMVTSRESLRVSGEWIYSVSDTSISPKKSHPLTWKQPQSFPL